MNSVRPHARRRPVFAAFAFAPLLLPTIAEAQHIYWSNDDGLNRARTDGSYSVALAPQDLKMYFADLEIDAAAGIVYWTHLGCGGWCSSRPTIRRITLDGQERTSIELPYDFEVAFFDIDETRQEIYYGGSNLGDLIFASRITRLCLLGGEMDVIVESDWLQWPSDLAVDPVNHSLYWADRWSGIFRVDLDGANDEVECPLGAGYVKDMAVDARNRILYWVEDNRIMRAELDGSVSRRVVTWESNGVGHIALDPLRSQVYWHVYDRRVGQLDQVWRANADGSDIELIIESKHVAGIAIDQRADGDFNADNRVDWDDHQQLVSCFTGPAGEKASDPCVFFDFDPTDGTTDLSDIAIFQNAFTGAD